MTGVLDSRPVCEELPDAIDGTQTPAPPPAPAPGSWLALGLEPFPGSNPKLLRETLWGEDQIQSFRALMLANRGPSGPVSKIRPIDLQRNLLALTARFRFRLQAARAEAPRSSTTSPPPRRNDLAAADAGGFQG